MINEGIFGFNNFAWHEIVKSSSVEGKMSEVNFMKALIDIHKKYFVPEKIVEAFKKSGVFPFDASEKFENNSDEKLPKIQRVENAKRYDEELKIIESMKELSGQLRIALEREGRRDLIKNIEVIEQQLKLIKNSLGRGI